MGDLTTAMARAADTLSESLAAPRTTGSQTRYGTVVANNGSTLDVAMAGGTIAGVPMTTACCSAVAGDRVLLDVTGPLVTATGILANSDNGPYVKWSSGIVTAQRIGSVVCLAVDGVATLGGSWGLGTLATLPKVLRPPYQIRAAATIQNTIATAIIEVSSAGAVLLSGKGANGLGGGNNWVFANAAWIVG